MSMSGEQLLKLKAAAWRRSKGHPLPGDGRLLLSGAAELIHEVDQLKADLAQAGQHGAEAYQRAGDNGALANDLRAGIEHLKTRLKAVRDAHHPCRTADCKLCDALGCGES